MSGQRADLGCQGRSGLQMTGAAPCYSHLPRVCYDCPAVTSPRVHNHNRNRECHSVWFRCCCCCCCCCDLLVTVNPAFRPLKLSVKLAEAGQYFMLLCRPSRVRSNVRLRESSYATHSASCNGVCQSYNGLRDMQMPPECRGVSYRGFRHVLKNECTGKRNGLHMLLHVTMACCLCMHCCNLPVFLYCCLFITMSNELQAPILVRAS